VFARLAGSNLSIANALEKTIGANVLFLEWMFDRSTLNCSSVYRTLGAEYSRQPWQLSARLDFTG